MRRHGEDATVFSQLRFETYHADEGWRTSHQMILKGESVTLGIDAFREFGHILLVV
jgi:hypothetical protein